MRRPRLSHRVSAECAVPAHAAFEFLCDGLALGRWALGAFGTRRVGPNLFRGASLFDGKRLLVKPVADTARLLVHYHVGTSAARLEPRIVARVAKRKRNSCIVSLLARRDAMMDDARWHRLIACHEVEILLIQALLART